MALLASMSDGAVRALAAVTAAGAALGVGMRARLIERRNAAAAPLDLDGFPGRLLFFTDAGCRRCDQARSLLVTAGVSFVETAFDREPDRLRTAGITAVPLLVGRDGDGHEVGRIAGRLGRRSLNRLLIRMG
jgi:hypothetical protein